MMNGRKKPRLVGNLIRSRREQLGLSQRALGMQFTPPVTTQFISNIERGVTSLPPAHVPTLSKALKISEAEMMAMLEREYTVKLSGQITGQPESLFQPAGVASSSFGSGNENDSSTEIEFIRSVYVAFRKADSATREEFISACGNMLGLTLRRTDQATPQPVEAAPTSSGT